MKFIVLRTGDSDRWEKITLFSRGKSWEISSAFNTWLDGSSRGKERTGCISGLQDVLENKIVKKSSVQC